MDFPFGEVLLPFSRAVDMEANFTDEVELAYDIVWSGDELKTFHPRTVVVAFGRDADAFMRTYANPSAMVEICKMNIFRKFISDEAQASKKPCSTITFYKPGSSKALLCCVPSLIDENLSVEVVEQLFGRLSHPPQLVYALSSAPNQQYRFFLGETLNEDDCFLRYLATSHFHKDQLSVLQNDCRPLIGNMISHLPAAVITYCEMHSIAAVAFVAYKPSSFETVDSVRSFVTLKRLSALKPFLDHVPSKEIQARLQLLHNQGGSVGLYI